MTSKESDTANRSDESDECLVRCEDAFERCETDGRGFSRCKEIHSGCITGCDSSMMTY